MKKIKNKISKISLYIFIVSFVLLFLSVFLIIYINFYTSTSNKTDKLNLYVQKLNIDFEYFSSELNIQISEAKKMESILNSYSYLRTIENIEDIIKNTKDYPYFNNLIIDYKNNLVDYLKTISAFINDTSSIWSEIRDYNIEKLNNSIKIITNESNIIKEEYRSKLFKIIFILMILIITMFINIVIVIFLYIKFSYRLLNFIQNITSFSLKLKNNEASVEEFYNKIKFSDYEELDNFSSIYFSIINDYNKINCDLNKELDKNFKENALYKSFNKFAISVLNSINYPIMVTDISDNIVFINAAFGFEFKENIDTMIRKNSKQYLNIEKYFIDIFSFNYNKKIIGKIYIYRDKNFYKKEITNITIDLSYSNLLDFLSKKRNIDVLVRHLLVINKKNKQRIDNVSRYIVSDLINSEFIYNKLDDIEIDLSPDLLRFVLYLVFYEIKDDLKIVVKKENNMINMIVESKKSKIDNSDFTKYIVKKLEKDFNLKIDYYSNSKGSRIRYIFLEE